MPYLQYVLTLNLNSIARCRCTFTEYVCVVPFNIADLLLTAMESTHWVLSCIFLKFKQRLVIHSHACSDKHGPHGRGNTLSGMASAPSVVISSSKQEPLFTPQWKGKGVCVGMALLYFQAENAICLAPGLREKYTDGHFLKPVAQMLCKRYCDYNIWGPTNAHAMGKQVPLCPESCWGKSPTVCLAGALSVDVCSSTTRGWLGPSTREYAGVGGIAARQSP